MYPNAAPFVVWFGLPAIAALLVSLLLLATRHVLRVRYASDELLQRRLFGRRAALVFAWLGLFSALALGGVLAHFELRPPPMLLMIAAVLIGAIMFSRKRIGRDLAEGLPLAVLVGVQAFRLPLELVMHEAARAGVMPVQMSFSGFNFDIVTGTLALLLAPLIALNKISPRVVLAWNVLGLGLLANVLGLALATSPLVHAFGYGAAINSWVCYFPFVYLPTVMVFCALAGHLLVFQRLRTPVAAAPRLANVTA